MLKQIDKLDQVSPHFFPENRHAVLQEVQPSPFLLLTYFSTESLDYCLL